MQECKTLNFKLGIFFFIENTYVYCGENSMIGHFHGCFYNTQLVDKVQVEFGLITTWSNNSKILNTASGRPRDIIPALNNPCDLTFKQHVWPWPWTYWQENDMWHILTSWLLFVPYLKKIPEIDMMLH